MLTKLEITKQVSWHLENVRLALEVFTGTRICFSQVSVNSGDRDIKGKVVLSTENMLHKKELGFERIPEAERSEIEVKFGRLPSGGIWFDFNGREYVAFTKPQPFFVKVFLMGSDPKTAFVGTSFVDRKEEPFASVMF